MMTLAELVKERRQQLGLSQNELADVIGVDRSYIGHIESRRMRLPGEDILQALSKALRLPLRQLAAAAYEAETSDLPEPTMEDLLRQAQVQYQRVRPVKIPYIEQAGAAGYLGGATAEAEIEYLPEDEHRGHKLIAVRVSGTCLEPRLYDTHLAIVDLNQDAVEGDIVLALHEGEAIFKELRTIDGRRHLVALQGQKPIPANSDTRIAGVVIDAKYGRKP